MPLNTEIIKINRGFFTDYALSWNPEQMQAPVLAVMGRHDYAISYTLWEEALASLPDFTFHLFEQSGHTPQLEEPEHFDRVLSAWLSYFTRDYDCER